MPEIPERLESMPRKGSTKYRLWQFAAYLAPFVYAAMLILWPHLLPAWLVVIAGIGVCFLFLIGLALHIRDVGGRKGLETYVHNHLWPSVATIVFVCCLILGTGIYFSVRPSHSKSVSPNQATSTIPPTTPRATPPTSTHPVVARPEPKPVAKKRKPKKESSTPQIQPQSTSAPTISTPGLACTDGSNCFTDNHGTVIGKQVFRASKPPPNFTILSVETEAAIPRPKLSFMGNPSTPEERRELDDLRRWYMNPESENDTHPGMAVIFRVDAPFQNPMYEVECDIPCVPDYLMYTVDGNGGSDGISSTPTSDPRVWIVGSGGMEFLTPAYKVTIGVRSKDENAIASTTIKPYIQ